MPANDLKGRPRRRLVAWALANLPMVCGLCGGPIDPTLDRMRHPMAATVDERLARANGGDALDYAGVQLAHRRCNSFKGKRPWTPERQAQLMRQLGRQERTQTRQW